ncbi:MAG: archease [Deltaproteobacteria bacterium]|nr:archease [Deltaproteobacteria bacterium]
MTAPRYTVVDHTGDFAFEVEAADLPSLVAAAVLAAADAQFGLESLSAIEPVEVACDGADPELLLFSALSEAVFLADARGLVPVTAEAAAVPGGGLLLRLGCDRLDPARHAARVLFKAATLHGLRVERTAAGVRATVVMDT